jgi:hypothetical protein
LGKFHIYLYRWDTSFEIFSVGGGITRGPDISHMALQTSRTMFRKVLNLNRIDRNELPVAKYLQQNEYVYCIYEYFLFAASTVKETWAKTEELLFQQGSVHTELNQKDLWHFALRQTVNGIKGKTLTEELLETTGNLPVVHTLALHGGYSRSKCSK